MTKLPPAATASPTAGQPLQQPWAPSLEANPQGLVIVDEAQRIVALNATAQRLLGGTAAQALGQPLERFVPEAARGRHGAQVREFAASATEQQRLQDGRCVPLRRLDGSTLWVEVWLSRVEMTQDGGPRVLYAAALREAAQQQALAQQIAALERRLRAVFELSPTAIWICDDDRLVFANRAAMRLFGAAAGEGLVGASLWTLLQPDSHAALRQAIERTLAGQDEAAPVAGRLASSDGAAREVEIALAALPDHGHRTVQMVVSDVTARRREAAELERSRRALRRLSANVVEAREEERRRIARELHDELGQRLTALKLELAHLAARPSKDGPARARMAEMESMLDETLAAVRRIASDLRPLMLDDLGLVAAIEWLAREAAQRMGIPVQVRLPAQEPAVDPRVATALYRMVQEALTNVARHALARTVEVALQASDGQLTLTVSDDGVGLHEQALQRSGSFGLMGLRERAQSLGGELGVAPRRGGGTRLTASVPAQAPPQDEAAP